MGEGKVIWWKEFCGNSSIYDALWDNVLSVNTTVPDLSNCFQKTVLTWFTCGFLWIASVFYLPFLCRKSRSSSLDHISVLNHFKVVVGILLVLLFVVDLLWFGICEFAEDAHHFNPVPVDFVDTAVKILTYVLATILTRWTFRVRIHSSGVLFLFWFLQLISGTVTFRSLILQGIHEDTMVTHVTFYMQFGLLVVSFVTCLFADLPRKRSMRVSEDSPLIREVGEELETNPCPNLKASFLSILFFWWFTPTIITGWRRTLTNDDIWNIRKEDSSAKIVPRFEENWRKEQAKASAQTGQVQ